MGGTGFEPVTSSVSVISGTRDKADGWRKRSPCVYPDDRRVPEPIDSQSDWPGERPLRWSRGAWAEDRSAAAVAEARHRGIAADQESYL